MKFEVRLTRESGGNESLLAFAINRLVFLKYFER